MTPKAEIITMTKQGLTDFILELKRTKVRHRSPYNKFLTTAEREDNDITRDLEIRTRSVPTAGHLLALGFEPLGVVTHPSGTKTFRFSPDAREALERFLLAKQRLDAMLAGTEPAP